MIYVAIYSRAPVAAEGIRSILATIPAECDTFSNPSNLSARLASAHVDIVLVDVDAAITVQILNDLKAVNLAAGIVLWGGTTQPEFISQAIGIGISGVVARTAPIEQVLRCVGCVAEGRMWIDQEVGKLLIAAKVVSLTPREQQIVGLLSQGQTNKEIASTLGITVGSAKVYLSRLFIKTGAGDRFALALLALKNLRSEPGSLESADGLSRIPFVPRRFVLNGYHPETKSSKDDLANLPVSIPFSAAMLIHRVA